MADKARRVSLAEQRELDDYRPPANFVTPAPQRPPATADPTQGPANDAMGQLVGGLMAESRTVHTADPIGRAAAMLIKATAVSVFLWLLTVAAMLMLSQWGFLLWLFLASLEWIACFIYLAYNDWRETPSAIRWQWTQGLLGMMQDEQTVRHVAQYGADAVRQARELDK